MRIQPNRSPLRLVAGLDAAFSNDKRWCLAAARDLVLRCATRHRSPGPIRLADQLVSAA